MLAPRDREPDPSDRAWQLAVQAAVLFAIDPVGTGGVRVRAQAGPVRDAWLALLRQLMGDRSWTRMPLSISDERLLGGLDLPATLAAGRPVLQPGLLVAANGGVLLLSMAERLPAGMAARIAQVIDSRELLLERDGLRERRAAAFGLVLLDEALADDPGVPEALADRLAFDIDLRAISPRMAMDDRLLAMTGGGDVDQARARMAATQIPDSATAALCATAVALGVHSMRASLLSLSVARTSAALDGNPECSEDDVQIAAALVLAPRATQLPAAAAENRDAEPPQEESTDDAASDMSPDTTPEQRMEQLQDQPQNQQQDEQDRPDREQDAAAHRNAQSAIEDRVLEAAQAAIPPGLLARLLSGGIMPRASAGRAGAQSQGGQRGRPVGSRRAPPQSGQRLHLIDTLRAAAPWQKLRRATMANAIVQTADTATVAATGAAARIQVRSEDFHVKRIRQKSATTTVFVVDASGSSALHRLAEAKGAVELLLADCYVRRDQVAVIAFRGKQAELLLPPTRSLTSAKRRLAGLPGGGGTPIATALDAASSLVDAVARRGQSPLLVLLTDGRANVARDGSGGRERAQQDALQSARQLALQQVPVLLIDTSPKPQREAAELAQAMRANYLPLPYAGASQMALSIRAATQQGMR